MTWSKLSMVGLMALLAVMTAVNVKQAWQIKDLQINQKILIKDMFKEVPPREEVPFGGVHSPTFRGS